MKFLTDIPISRGVAAHLAAQGHDVAMAADRLGPSAPDDALIRLAVAEGRTIICFDLDFATLVALSESSSPSVITFRTARHSSEFVRQKLDAVLPQLESDLLHGALVTIDDHRVRIRLLPVDRDDEIMG